MKIKNNKKAFTMVELLIVMVIIAVLAAIALPKYINTVDIALGKKAYDTMQVLYAAQLRFAGEQPNGTAYPYATNLKTLDVSFPSATFSNKNNTNDTVNFGKYSITTYVGGVTNHYSQTSGLENYYLDFNYYDETKKCIASNNKGARVCRAIGGIETSDALKFDLP
ncbi:prepilin-type N-terminal cleavage/methylation domain-containing protein [Elusimicrobium simillimum]|uniref:type II secretion system protein n=1 Tax=Elusimicrobium simillimum TaxID=3143438 RepID=UPI003C6FDEE8